VVFFFFLVKILLLLNFIDKLTEPPKSRNTSLSDSLAKQTPPENHYHSTSILLDNISLSSFLSVFFSVTRMMGECCCYGWFVGVRIIPLTNNIEVLTVCRGSRAPYWERQSLLPSTFPFWFPLSTYSIRARI